MKQNTFHIFASDVFGSFNDNNKVATIVSTEVCPAAALKGWLMSLGALNYESDCILDRNTTFICYPKSGVIERILPNYRTAQVVFHFSHEKNNNGAITGIDYQGSVLLSCEPHDPKYHFNL